MSKNKDLILPWLPENLENLHKNEEEIRTNSILQINANTSIKDHIDIVYDSLNLLFDFTISYKNQTDDELTIQYLGVRLFNSIISSIKLLLTGYYQGAVIFQRDILEVGFLLDFFSMDPSKISDWKNSNRQQRLKKYNPFKIRRALDNRDGLKEKNRYIKYQMMCEYAAHATYPGFLLVAPKKLVQIGPFFNLKYLMFLVQELAMDVPLFTLIYIHHFKNLPSSFLKLQSDYLGKLQAWSKKYLKLDIKKIDVELIKEWVKITVRPKK